MEYIPRKLTITQTLERLKDINNETPDAHVQNIINDLAMDLAHTRYIESTKQAWDLPSIIVGGLAATAIALLLFPQEVCADSLDLNITSWHADTTYEYNNKNFGIGYTKDINHHWQVQTGGFKNSYNKDSLYALVNLKHEMNGWNFGVAFGFVTGYDDIEANKGIALKSGNGQKSSSLRSHHSDEQGNQVSKYKVKDAPHSHPKNLNAIQFMALPNITWKITKKHALNLTVVPAMTKDTFTFAGLKYQYILGE